MKKIVAIVLMLLFLVSLFSGCNPETPAERRLREAREAQADMERALQKTRENYQEFVDEMEEYDRLRDALEGN